MTRSTWPPTIDVEGEVVEGDDYASGYANSYDQAGEVNQGLRLVSDKEVQEAKRAGHLFVQLMRKVRAGMSARDRQFYEMGLRAAHMEEALATGEVERGEEHFKKLLEVASRILTDRMEHALAQGDDQRAADAFAKLARLEARYGHIL